MRERTREQRRRLCADADALIAARYRGWLTVGGAAAMLSVSPRELQRAYAEVAATSFSERLVAVRLSAAAQLLAEQAIAVADIARLVGYRQPSAFAAAFRRRYGLAPARYREAARAGSGGWRPAVGYGGEVNPQRTGSTVRGW
jgi:AraC-like DNA-binding protein